MPRAIEFQAEHNWQDVRAACHSRLAAFRERNHQRYGVAPLYPNTPDWFGQMALIEIPDPGIELIELKARLMADYGIEIPCMRHGDTTCVRLSVQGYVTDDDLDVLETAIAEISAGR